MLKPGVQQFRDDGLLTQSGVHPLGVWPCVGREVTRVDRATTMVDKRRNEGMMKMSRKEDNWAKNLLAKVRRRSLVTRHFCIEGVTAFFKYVLQSALLVGCAHQKVVTSLRLLEFCCGVLGQGVAHPMASRMHAGTCR